MSDDVSAKLEAARALMPAHIREAHARSIHHGAEIKRSDECGCFYCLAKFKPTAIEDWTDDGDTALCPRCGIDSVIGSASGIALSDEFLKTMQSYWF